MRILNEQDYALLSDHVYGNKKGQLELNGNGETTLNGITYKVIEQKSNPQNGYFGAIYRRIDTNELIVVHRGTDDARDGKTDMLMLRDKYNRQFPDAEALTQQANKLAVSDYPNTRIYQTGHSLGGTLAQMCGYKYRQQTQTYNAYGAAELTEMRAINNPHAYQLITNHRMGGDMVSSASPHLGREIVYADQAAVRKLHIRGYGNDNRRDNWVYLAMKDNFATHGISNFTDEGGLSVLSPRSVARQLAQENAALLEEFRREVQKTAKEAPEKFERLFDMVDKYIAGNQKPDFYGQQNQPQYAQARSLSINDVPAPAQKLYAQTEERMRAFYQEFDIPFQEHELKNAAAALAVVAYEKRLPEVQDFELHNGRMVAFYESRGGAYKEALLDAGFANNMPQQESFARMIEAEPKLELAARQRAMEIAAYEQSQSMGRSI